MLTLLAIGVFLVVSLVVILGVCYLVSKSSNVNENSEIVTLSVLIVVYVAALFLFVDFIHNCTVFTKKEIVVIKCEVNGTNVMKTNINCISK